MNTRARPPYHGREVNSTSPPGFSQMRYSPLGRNNFRESSFHPTASGSALHRPSESRTQSPIGPLLARSRAEQVLFDLTASGEKVNAGKYRQLPCRTFLATGHCPYKDRCVYLHCPSIRSAFMVRSYWSFDDILPPSNPIFALVLLLTICVTCVHLLAFVLFSSLPFTKREC